MSKQIYHGQDRYTLGDLIKEVQHIYSNSQSDDLEKFGIDHRVDPKVVNAVIRTFFDRFESRLVNGQSVSIIRFGKFERRDSRPDNFGAKKTNRSKQHHKYQSIKFTASRDLKRRATRIKDGLNDEIKIKD